MAIITSIAATWIYEKHFSSERFFEFHDSSPFSVAMRQCYSVPEGYTRVLLLVTKQSKPIPPEKINLIGRLSNEIAIVDFKSLKSLTEAGYILTTESAHLTELRDFDSKETITSFKAQGIAAFDIFKSKIANAELGFSPTGSHRDLAYGNGGVFYPHSGKCSVVNIILLTKDSCRL